jgi:hypothetical protein
LGALEIPQFYLPVNTAGKGVIYAPRLYGAAQILFTDKRRGLSETRSVAVILPLDPAVRSIDWDIARAIDVAPAQLLVEPPVKAPYLPLSASAMQVATFTRWAKQFDRWLARTQRVIVMPTPQGEAIEIAPKRGGVTVELVAIVWELPAEAPSATSAVG